MVRCAAASGWARQWWSILSVAVQQTVGTTALGRAWPSISTAARARCRARAQRLAAEGVAVEEQRGGIRCMAQTSPGIA